MLVAAYLVVVLKKDSTTYLVADTDRPIIESGAQTLVIASALDETFELAREKLLSERLTFGPDYYWLIEQGFGLKVTPFKYWGKEPSTRGWSEIKRRRFFIERSFGVRITKMDRVEPTHRTILARWFRI